ncbi:nuclear transport factor 2 family protein [Alterisphingorhabdus coralli]|uniref:Nuclear transport factor 2 family protein n=1 Tax=Alterisphingorhabdus coralli TaxID=3071408 RepID=A0AA97F8Y9_9SPHN|nr:nuclear transport factor 2 family protein [Parasphingorhabdus sp. SCSIO 66989]WOE74665.1 nuclear transport factor 2 family protein [Parasphingorhabdus sp. SCSIO 66989]
MLSRAAMVRIAIDQYFATIDKDSIKETLGFFRPDASFTLYPSGRVFTGHKQIADMYAGVFARHERIDREILEVAADTETGTLCASFKAMAYPKDRPPMTMHNVNFWRFEGRQFAWVKVYSSDRAL